MTDLEDLYNKIKIKYYHQSINIRVESNRAKCIDYYLGEHNKIILWNKKKHLLNFNFFHSDISLIKDYKDILNNLYNKCILPLTNNLNEIIKNGWKWKKLTKKRYNLIVYFTDFSNKLLKFINSPEMSLKLFLIMEEAFLKITYLNDYPQIIIRGLEDYIIHENISNNEKIEEEQIKIENLNNFFSEEYYNPSIYDLIIAFNISIYRRFYKFQELKTPSINNVIPAGFYYCSFDVFTEIFNQIKSIINNLALLDKEKEYIDWIKNISTDKENKNPRKLIEFYSNLGQNWGNDLNDIFMLFIRLIEGIIKKLSNLFFNDWELATSRNDFIKQKMVNDEKVNNILNTIINDFNLIKGRHDNIIHQKISILELFERKDNIYLINTNHKYIYEKVISIFTNFFIMANIFNNLVKNKENKNNNSLNYLLVSNEEWCGKPVYNILEYYSEIFLNICSFFKIGELFDQVNRIKYLEDQIKILREKLERIKDDNDIIENFISKTMKKDIDNLLQQK